MRFGAVTQGLGQVHRSISLKIKGQNSIEHHNNNNNNNNDNSHNNNNDESMESTDKYRTITLASKSSSLPKILSSSPQPISEPSIYSTSEQSKSESTLTFSDRLSNISIEKLAKKDDKNCSIIDKLDRVVEMETDVQSDKPISTIVAATEHKTCEENEKVIDESELNFDKGNDNCIDNIKVTKDGDKKTNCNLDSVSLGDDRSLFYSSINDGQIWDEAVSETTLNELCLKGGLVKIDGLQPKENTISDDIDGTSVVIERKKPIQIVCEDEVESDSIKCINNESCKNEITSADTSSFSYKNEPTSRKNIGVADKFDLPEDSAAKNYSTINNQLLSPKALKRKPEDSAAKNYSTINNQLLSPKALKRKSSISGSFMTNTRRRLSASNKNAIKPNIASYKRKSMTFTKRMGGAGTSPVTPMDGLAKVQITTSTSLPAGNLPVYCSFNQQDIDEIKFNSSKTRALQKELTLTQAHAKIPSSHPTENSKSSNVNALDSDKTKAKDTPKLDFLQGLSATELRVLLMDRSIGVPSHLSKEELISTLLKNWTLIGAEVSTRVKKKECGHCNKPVKEGNYIFRLDRYWHKDHYRCAHCKKFPQRIPFLDLSMEEGLQKKARQASPNSNSTTPVNEATSPTLTSASTTCNRIESHKHNYDLDSKSGFFKDGKHKRDKKALAKSKTFDVSDTIFRSISKPQRPKKSYQYHTIHGQQNTFVKNSENDPGDKITHTCETSGSQDSSKGTQSRKNSRRNSNPLHYHPIRRCKSFSVSVLSLAHDIREEKKKVDAMISGPLYIEYQKDNNSANVGAPRNYADDVDHYEVFFEEDGKPYCQKDWYELYGITCAGCSMSIASASMVLALKSNWHAHCFKCMAPGCTRGFDDNEFFEFEDKAFCEYHYLEARKFLCFVCSKIINGQYVTDEYDRRYHSRHLACIRCKKSLHNKQTQLNSDNKPVCAHCFGKK
eukprot:Awhi_evm1s4416